MVTIWADDEVELLARDDFRVRVRHEVAVNECTRPFINEIVLESPSEGAQEESKRQGKRGWSGMKVLASLQCDPSNLTAPLAAMLCLDALALR